MRLVLITVGVLTIIGGLHLGVTAMNSGDSNTGVLYVAAGVLGSVMPFTLAEVLRLLGKIAGEESERRARDTAEWFNSSGPSS